MYLILCNSPKFNIQNSFLKLLFKFSKAVNYIGGEEAAIDDDDDDDDESAEDDSAEEEGTANAAETVAETEAEADPDTEELTLLSIGDDLFEAFFSDDEPPKKKKPEVAAAVPAAGE